MIVTRTTNIHNDVIYIVESLTFYKGSPYYHREDGPAIEYSDGRKEWYQNGLRHRIDGPAIEYSDGRKEWYQNGLRHRIDGPAREFANGDQEWWVNGKRHRVDGPACIYVVSYYKFSQKLWFYEGDPIQCSSQEEFDRLIKLKAFW